MLNLETTVADTASAVSGKADWDALRADMVEVVTEPEKPIIEPTTKPEEIVVDKSEETPVEPTAEEKLKTETEALKTEALGLGLTETATKEEVEAAKLLIPEEKPLEFKLEDVTDVPQTYQDGTFQALAKDVFGIDLKEESVEAFKESFVPREEFDKVQNITIDTLLSSLKPEVATAIKLMQMGYSEDQVLAPTREIEYHLSLDDAALIRADLEAQGDLSEEIIENKMELLTTEPQKLKLVADELRIYLNREKTQILHNRTQTLQKYELDKQNAIAHQKQQERTQVTNELNKISTFMGVPIGKDVQDAFIAKYNKGVYDNDLNSPASKAQFIFQKEMQEKLTKHLQNKASEKAKVDARKQLLNTPPVIAGAGQNVDISKQPTKGYWDDLVNEK